MMMMNEPPLQISQGAAGVHGEEHDVDEDAAFPAVGDVELEGEECE